MCRRCLQWFRCPAVRKQRQAIPFHLHDQQQQHCDLTVITTRLFGFGFDDDASATEARPPLQSAERLHQRNPNRTRPRRARSVLLQLYEYRRH